jgi:hypothetical protein
MPSDVRQALKEKYYRSAVWNMRLYYQLSKLVGAFHHEGIAVILLKGAHLAEFVYGNIALRPMGDLDLLVRNSDLLRVSALLAEKGYTQSREEMGIALNHYAPFCKADSLPIDVHFNIVNPPISRKFDVGELWERARKESIQGVEVLTLCPEDLILNLCVHASIHHVFCNGIMPFVDISRTLEHYHKEIDWEKLLTRSRQWGVIRCVYVMLALSEKMLGLTVPEQVKIQTTPDFSDFDATASAEELVFENDSTMTPDVARLFGNNSWPDKFKHVMRRAFPPPQTMSVVEGLGGNKFSICFMYFSRIRGIWKRHGKAIWRALLNDRDTSVSVGIENRRNRLKDWFEETQ